MSSESSDNDSHIEPSYHEEKDEDQWICPTCQVKLAGKKILLSCGHVVCPNPKCSKRSRCGICKQGIDKIIRNDLFMEACMNCGENYKSSSLLCGKQKRKYNLGCHKICSSCINMGMSKLICPACNKYATNQKIMHELTKYRYSEIKIIEIFQSFRGGPIYRSILIGIINKCGDGYLCEFLADPSKYECECQKTYNCMVLKTNVFYMEDIKIYHLYNSKYNLCNKWKVKTSSSD